MKFLRSLPCFISLFLTVVTIYSEDQATLLRYIHREGEVLHADALVNETVILNGTLSHKAVIEEFSNSRVISVDDHGNAQLDSRFRTVEEAHAHNGSFQWISEELISLQRDSTGVMILPEDAVFPVLRSVPRFPEYPVAPGDSWSFPAEEVHVFRMWDDLHGPYRGKLQVLYRYIENMSTGEGLAARISLEYNVYLPVRSSSEPIYLITGRSEQEILWNISRGRPIRKDEDFEFIMMTSDGSTREFIGSTETTYRYTMTLDSEKDAEVLREDLRSVPGIKVESVDQGILLSLNEETGRILFQPESALITEKQKKQLETISRSLEGYRERDVLITGHTAEYGTAAGREKLSLERAAAVAQELFPEGRPGPGRLFLRGAGSSEALDSDHENRRVEILILD